MSEKGRVVCGSVGPKIASVGHRKAVLLPIEEFKELLQDIEDLAAIAERRAEPTISHDEVVADLKRDGLI